ncbi:MAG: hypothetical protein ACF8SC_05070 [Phycisphaerales bacterium JB037]
MTRAQDQKPKPPKRVTISKNWVTFFAFILPVTGIFAILWAINVSLDKGSEMAGAPPVGAGAGRTGMLNQYMGEPQEPAGPEQADPTEPDDLSEPPDADLPPED